MTRRIAPLTQTLPIPPDKYDSAFMQRLVAILQRVSHNQEHAATLRGGWLNLSDLETNVYKLSVGDVWEDNSYLRIVRPGDYGSGGEGLTLSIGAVTVTTA